MRRCRLSPLLDLPAHKIAVEMVKIDLLRIKNRTGRQAAETFPAVGCVSGSVAGSVSGSVSCPCFCPDSVSSLCSSPCFCSGLCSGFILRLLPLSPAQSFRRCLPTAHRSPVTRLVPRMRRCHRFRLSFYQCKPLQPQLIIPPVFRQVSMSYQLRFGSYARCGFLCLSCSFLYSPN